MEAAIERQTMKKVYLRLLPFCFVLYFICYLAVQSPLPWFPPIIIDVGLGLTRIARHRRVTQCLGALGGKEWLIGVAPPGDLGDEARPRVEDIAAFRVPGNRLIKLHVATWHAGPHFVHDECLFVNLENLDTNRRDFHAVPLDVECRYRL